MMYEMLRYTVNQGKMEGFCQNSGLIDDRFALGASRPSRGAYVPGQLPPAGHEHISSRRQRCNGLVDSEVVMDLVERCTKPGC